MKRRKFVNLIGGSLLLGSCKCQDEENMRVSKVLNHWSGTPRVPSVIGTLYNSSSWADLSNFTNQGAIPSIVSNEIQFGDTTGFTNKSLDYNYYTALEKWVQVGRFKVGSKTINSFGFGLGIRSYNTTSLQRLHCYGWFNMSTDATYGGKVLIYNYDTSNSLVLSAQSATKLTFSVNDIIELTVTRLKNVITISAYNVTTASSPITCTYTFPLVGFGGQVLPNTGRFSVWSLGGLFTLKSWNISSTLYYNSKIVLIGDSKGIGYSVTAIADRFCELLTTLYGVGEVEVNAQGSDGLAEHLLRIPELQSMAPEIYLILGTSNDKRAGRSDAAVNADYDSFVSQLSSYGRIVHTTGLKENVLDQSALRAHILATYATADIIDTLPTTLGVVADGIHPNTAGNLTFYNLLVASGKL